MIIMMIDSQVFQLPNDLLGVTLNAALYDSWSLDDGDNAVPYAVPSGSLTQLYHTLGAKVDAHSAGLQAVYAGIEDLYNYVFYFRAGYNHPNFHIKAEYGMSNLAESGFNKLGAPTLYKDHSLMTAEVGVKFSPVAFRGGVYHFRRMVIK